MLQLWATQSKHSKLASVVYFCKLKIKQKFGSHYRGLQSVLFGGFGGKAGHSCLTPGGSREESCGQRPTFYWNKHRVWGRLPAGKESLFTKHYGLKSAIYLHPPLLTCLQQHALQNLKTCKPSHSRCLLLIASIQLLYKHIWLFGANKLAGKSVVYLCICILHNANKHKCSLGQSRMTNALFFFFL